LRSKGTADSKLNYKPLFLKIVNRALAALLQNINVIAWKKLPVTCNILQPALTLSEIGDKPIF
jgi:hypothetical protein